MENIKRFEKLRNLEISICFWKDKILKIGKIKKSQSSSHNLKILEKL